MLRQDERGRGGEEEEKRRRRGREEKGKRKGREEKGKRKGREREEERLLFIYSGTRTGSQSRGSVDTGAGPMPFKAQFVSEDFTKTQHHSIDKGQEQIYD